MEILEGSYGGRYGMDGMDAVDTLYANTRNNPIEDIELHLPIRVNRYELREKRWRRAPGAAASARSASSPISSMAGFRVEGEGHKYRPWGFQRRQRRPDRLAAPRLDGERDGLLSKVPYRKVSAGDRLVSYGPTAAATAIRWARSGRVLRLLDGYLTAESALTDYGVVTKDGEVNVTATIAERARRA